MLKLGPFADPPRLTESNDPVLDVVGCAGDGRIPAAVYELPVPGMDGIKEALIGQRRAGLNAEDAMSRRTR